MKYQILGPDDPALIVLDAQLKAHPEWETSLRILPWAQYQPEMNAALHANHSPYQAVCVPGHIWLPGLAHAGQLAAFEDLLPRVPAGRIAAYHAPDIMPAVAAECRYVGRQYILPLFTDGHILFYRKDVFDLKDSTGVAVVNPQHLPVLLEKATLKEGMFPLALKAHASESLTDWLPYLWAFGGEILDGDNQPAFTSPAAIHSLEFYCSLKRFCPPEPHTYGNLEIANALKEGRAAMAASWGGQAAMILDDSNPYRKQIGAAVFPTPWNATWGVSIPANQPLSDQTGMMSILYDAASPLLDRQVTRIAGSPVRSASYNPDELQAFSWLPAQHEMLRRCQSLPPVPELSRYLGALYQAVAQAFTGEKSAEEALKDATIGR
jgi:multiple sugar transport system substrate-binding protein